MVDNVIMSSEYKDSLDEGYLCRRRAHQRGCYASIAAEVAVSLFIPGVAASLAVRGAYMATRAGTAVARAAAIAEMTRRGIIFSTYAAEFALAGDDAIRDCAVTRNPNYFESKRVPGCSAQRRLAEAANDASVSSCVMSVGLGLAPIGVLAAVETVADSGRAIGRIADAAENGSAARTADGVGARSGITPGARSIDGRADRSVDNIIVVNGNASVARRAWTDEEVTENLLEDFPGQSSYVEDLLGLKALPLASIDQTEEALRRAHELWKRNNSGLRESRPELFSDFDDLPLTQRQLYADQLDTIIYRSNPEADLSGFDNYNDLFLRVGSPSPGEVRARIANTSGDTMRNADSPRRASSGSSDLSLVRSGELSEVVAPIQLPSAALETIHQTGVRIRQLRFTHSGEEIFNILGSIENPRLRSGFEAGARALQNKEMIIAYIQRLQKDAFIKALTDEKYVGTDIAVQANRGVLHDSVVKSVLDERMNSRGINRVVLTEALSEGDFRKAIGRGYIVDPGANEEFFDHGVYSHLLQQDFTYDLISSVSGQSHVEIIQFMGTESGFKIWDEMYDGLIPDGQDEFIPKNNPFSPEFFNRNIMSPNLPLD